MSIDTKLIYWNMTTKIKQKAVEKNPQDRPKIRPGATHSKKNLVLSAWIFSPKLSNFEHKIQQPQKVSIEADSDQRRWYLEELWNESWSIEIAFLLRKRIFKNQKSSGDFFFLRPSCFSSNMSWRMKLFSKVEFS